MNYKQLYAIQSQNKKKIKKIVKDIENKSGIYILTREENDFKYAYIGQAKHLIDRLANHLSGYQHIDLSLKKHGLYDENNKKGWNISYLYIEEDKLDIKEQEYIIKFANLSYQLYNHTTGSQGVGKSSLKENVRKGYKQGVDYGYNKARKEVYNLFDKHLKYDVKKEGNKNQEKAKNKFEKFLNIDYGRDE